MRFSRRYRIVPVRESLQIESMDDNLKNALWDAITVHYISLFEERETKDVRALFMDIWHELINQPIDTIPRQDSEKVRFLRSVYFASPWHSIYDLIEFLPQHYDASLTNYVYSRKDINSNFRRFCNEVLEREKSAYRFVNDLIVPITSPEEMQTIEDASSHGGKFITVDIHIQTALSLLSDRKTPDYRNSIKESISAIEALCRLLVPQDNASTLAKALNVLEAKHNLHPALKASFNSLYGYTSDAGGIRHAMLDESDLTFEDAYYMLVTCTAFVNYLTSKFSHIIK